MSESKKSPEHHRALLKRAEDAYKKKVHQNLLPHLYGLKPYKWNIEFWQSRSRMKLIVGANQISKSTTLIRHVIDLATDKSKWDPKAGYFPKRRPRAFWYIYPDFNIVDDEFLEKWEREWLPKGAMKDDPTYGWAPMKTRNRISGIRFNSGVNLYFKTWGTDNQAGTVDLVAVDEEIPQEHYDELARRLTTTEGMYIGAFTATLGQPFWYQAMELVGKKGERFPHAYKRCISVYDCLEYFDGTPSSIWTQEKIIREKNKCSTEAEVQKRIYGRFASTEGLIYPSFSKKNIKPGGPVPPDWLYYGGVDIGTGGATGHPAAISIVAISPDFKKGRVVKFWRGPKTHFTNSSDILNQYRRMTAGLLMSGNYYDWHSKEFQLRATEAGLPFVGADKGQDFGQDLLNVLFKNEMLDIDAELEQVDELAQEYETLRHNMPKTKAQDDGIDSNRYAVSKIPWDFSDINQDRIIFVEKQIATIDEERVQNADRMMGLELEAEDDLDSYFEELNSYAEGY